MVRRTRYSVLSTLESEQVEDFGDGAKILEDPRFPYLGDQDQLRCGWCPKYIQAVPHIGTTLIELIWQCVLSGFIYQISPLKTHVPCSQNTVHIGQFQALQTLTASEMYSTQKSNHGRVPQGKLRLHYFQR